MPLQVRTTPDGQADRHPDLVDRQFVADRPNVPVQAARQDNAGT